LNGGVKINIEGYDSDPIVRELNAFLTSIGHNYKDFSEDQQKHNNIALRISNKISSSAALNQDAHLIKNIDTSKNFFSCITVYVMNDFKQRDALFGSENLPFDSRSTLFVWSNPNNDPFTKDEIGERLMRFLVLVAGWDRKLLAENLFSAIGVRVVDTMHSSEVDMEVDSNLVGSPNISKK
jgi:hypothetical protein